MAETHTFQAGEFSCLAVSDGSFDYPPAALFSNAPAEELRSELDRVGATGSLITTPYTFLLVDTGEHRILVDLGAGSLAPTTGKLQANLRDAGYGPDDIDYVVITHAHPDHVGGALDDRAGLRFPQARYYIWRREWDYWFSDEAARISWEHFDFTAIARKNIGPMEPRMTFVDSEEPFLEGVGMLDAPGHTPGHVAVTFRSGREKLMYVADTVIFPLHLEHPDWVPVFDMLPDQARNSKRRIFDMAAEEGWLVMAQHFPPFPSLGRVEKKGAGWLWKPVA